MEVPILAVAMALLPNLTAITPVEAAWPRSKIHTNEVFKGCKREIWQPLLSAVQNKTLLAEPFLESDRMSDDHATASRPLAAILVALGLSRKALTKFAFCDVS